MSTTYYPTPVLPSLSEVLARLPEGVSVVPRDVQYNCPYACLTDGTFFVHAYEWNGGVSFERFGGNKIFGLLTSIGAAMGVESWVDHYGLPLDSDG